jgi:hypothetical protein
MFSSPLRLAGSVQPVQGPSRSCVIAKEATFARDSLLPPSWQVDLSSRQWVSGDSQAYAKDDPEMEFAVGYLKWSYKQAKFTTE